ncbi:MAG: hypothetical protein JWN78_478 [Bacteroidota bacterium]|nr:hypothetical protein [Bacteroidota bacterium]
MKKIYFVSIITLVSFLSACKKDSSIGADILPNSDLLNVRFTDSFSLSVKTLGDTFLRTDKLSKNFLGVVNDPQFGFQKASIVIELDRPSTVYDDTLGPFTLDSVVLFLGYTSVYGDTTVAQSFNVYANNNKVIETNAYYSNSIFPVGGLLGSVTNYYFQPTTTKVMTFATDTIGSIRTLRIKLNSFVGYSILNLGQNILRDSTAFKNSFPGVIVENASNAGKAMAEINLVSTNSHLSIFYKNKYGVQQQMKLNPNIFNFTSGVLSYRQNSINLFTNTLSSIVTNTINSGMPSDSVNYILGQGGTIIRVGMPTVSNLGKVAVNKAVLSVSQVQQNNSTALQTPSFLLLLKRNSVGNLDILSTGDGIGLLDTTAIDVLGNKISVYNFNISQYIQKVSTGQETNTDLFIATYRSGGNDGTVNGLNTITNGNTINFSYTPSRVIVGGPNYSDARYKMKLNLTYTLIK